MNVRHYRKLFGKRLQGARKTAGKSLACVGHRCGVSASTVSRWESGDASPTVDQLVIAADLVGCGVQELATGDAPEGLDLSIYGPLARQLALNILASVRETEQQATASWPTYWRSHGGGPDVPPPPWLID